MPITNETVSTIEELYATDEENGWLVLASTFRKKEFYEDRQYEMTPSLVKRGFTCHT